MKKIFLLTLILLYFKTGNAQQTLTLQAPEHKIEVTGSAEMEVVPDEIYVGVTLQEYRKENKTKLSIDEISKEFLAKCEKAGIGKDRIEVQDMSGFDQSNWYWRKRKKEQPDLMQSATYLIKFTSPGEIDRLTAALDDNATQNIYIARTSHSKEKEYRKTLKTQALKNAQEKAGYMLEGIGSKAGKVVFVKEIESGNMYPIMYKSAMMANSAFESDAAGANEGLNFKKIKYRYEVEAHFLID